jgi:hypothetical protein
VRTRLSQHMNRRPPLVQRSLPISVQPASGSTKRPRSPDANSTTAKRPRPSPSNAAMRKEERKAKENRKAEREIQRADFRLKYTKAFPSWSFYFDSDHLGVDHSLRELLESKISQLGGVRKSKFIHIICLRSYLHNIAHRGLFLERDHPPNHQSAYSRRHK